MSAELKKRIALVDRRKAKIKRLPCPCGSLRTTGEPGTDPDCRACKDAYIDFMHAEANMRIAAEQAAKR